MKNELWNGTLNPELKNRSLKGTHSTVFDKMNNKRKNLDFSENGFKITSRVYIQT